ncbi:hypothetical protein VP01_173g1 [Puccinia sorghi]|uniref:Uncharacterized protein n=1 Tax=Puccinia sorghi TaxID=27349 RepID=A0A0L6VF84_9BASI|nr:hypothetical protein VP01_173g1 [Puccinia sorghi]
MFEYSLLFSMNVKRIRDKKFCDFLTCVEWELNSDLGSTPEAEPGRCFQAYKDSTQACTPASQLCHSTLSLSQSTLSHSALFKLSSPNTLTISHILHKSNTSLSLVRICHKTTSIHLFFSHPIFIIDSTESILVILLSSCCNFPFFFYIFYYLLWSSVIANLLFVSNLFGQMRNTIKVINFFFLYLWMDVMSECLFFSSSDCENSPTLGSTIKVVIFLQESVINLILISFQLNFIGMQGIFRAYTTAYQGSHRHLDRLMSSSKILQNRQDSPSPSLTFPKLIPASSILSTCHHPYNTPFHPLVLFFKAPVRQKHPCYPGISSREKLKHTCFQAPLCFPIFGHKNPPKLKIKTLLYFSTNFFIICSIYLEDIPLLLDTDVGVAFDQSCKGGYFQGNEIMCLSNTYSETCQRPSEIEFTSMTEMCQSISQLIIVGCGVPFALQFQKNMAELLGGSVIIAKLGFLEN